MSTIFASIGGFFDGQSKFKNHWFNPGNSPLYSRLAKMFENASLTISIIYTILNPDLTTSQKVGQIVINTAAFIGSYALSSDLVSTLGVGFVVGGPVIMLSLLLVTLAILQSILISLIIESYLTNRNYKDNKEGLLA